ncbi:MAG: hypothetical protein ABIK83_02690 [Candidatus Zixiibacteriota bacterium]
MSLHHDDMLDCAAKLWSRRYGRSVSRDEARDIAANIGSFFDLLSEWERKKEQSRATNPEDQNDTQRGGETVVDSHESVPSIPGLRCADLPVGLTAGSAKVGYPCSRTVTLDYYRKRFLGSGRSWRERLRRMQHR